MESEQKENILFHKCIKKIAVACAFSVLMINPATASTWNVFAQTFTKNSLFFFDADTVLKEPDTVTIWVKYVNTVTPDTDGSWATASRFVFKCSKRKSQALTSSTYDKDGKFMHSPPNPSPQRDITPDTIVEGMYTAACQKDFPKNKSEEFYFPVKDNDIYAFTKRYVEDIESKKDLAPQ
jgi:hypothetical protein